MRYAGAAGESVNEIRLSPADNGRQRVEWSHVRVEPAAELFGHIDAFGNQVCWFQLVGDHERLVVESEAIVLTMPARRHRASAGGEMADLDDPAYADAPRRVPGAVGARPLGRAGRRARATAWRSTRTRGRSPGCAAWRRR